MHVASAGFAGVRAGVLVFGRHLAVLRGRCVLWSLPVLLWVLPILLVLPVLWVLPIRGDGLAEVLGGGAGAGIPGRRRRVRHTVGVLGCGADRRVVVEPCAFRLGGRAMNTMPVTALASMINPPMANAPKPPVARAS